MIRYLQRLLPTPGYKKKHLILLEDLCTKDDFLFLKKYLKSDHISVAYESLQTNFLKHQKFPQIFPTKEQSPLKSQITEINVSIKKEVLKRFYSDFSKLAPYFFPLIMRDVSDLDAVKRTLMLQLFSLDPIQILIMADERVQIKELIKTVCSFDSQSKVDEAENLSFGKFSPFLSLKQGIFAVEHLEKIGEKKQAQLAKVLQSNSISYTQADKSRQEDIKCSFLAHATPQGGFFVGKGFDILLKQIPFSQDLRDSFQIIFLIRDMNRQKFSDVIEITKDIEQDLQIPDELTPEDMDFLQGYIEYARDIEVDVPNSCEKIITDWSEKVIQADYLQVSNISKSQLVGIIRIAKANARMHLRDQVGAKDLKIAFDLLQTSIEITN